MADPTWAAVSIPSVALLTYASFIGYRIHKKTEKDSQVWFFLTFSTLLALSLPLAHTLYGLCQLGLCGFTSETLIKWGALIMLASASMTFVSALVIKKETET